MDQQDRGFLKDEYLKLQDLFEDFDRRSLTIKGWVSAGAAVAIVAGAALAFARAIGEFGSLVLITGNIPFDTQVASVFIYSKIESDNTTAAAAVSVLLLFISVLVLFALSLFGRWRSRHERA